MKKISLILLILIYTSSTFGMVVKEFYCCGKLASVSFSLENDSKIKSDKQVNINMPDCCKTTIFSSKVKDNHIPSDAVVIGTKYFIQSAAWPSPFNANTFVNSQLTVTNGINDPPLLHSDIPVYIYIRSIRI
jgi:hypothetical protein